MRKIKYKDLINRLKPYANDKIVMVASNGEVSFFDEEEMKRITHLVETDEEDHCYVTERNDL